MPELSTVLTYSLLAFGAFFALAGAMRIGSRLFPSNLPFRTLQELLVRMDALEVAHEGFAAQYGLTNVQTKAQIGKMRRALARERGEDDEEPDADATPPVPRQPGVLNSKTDLREAARQAGVIE